MAYQQNYQRQGGYYQQNQEQRQRRPSFWHQIHREMMDALLQMDRLDDKTRAYIESLTAERQPTNNMKSVLCKIFAEKMHRPNKPYTIEPWQPRQDASGYQPQKQPYQKIYGPGDQNQQYQRGRGVGQPQQYRQQQAPFPSCYPPSDQMDDPDERLQAAGPAEAPPAEDTPGEAAPMSNDDGWMND